MIVDYSLFTGPALILGIVLACLLVVSVVAVVRSQRRAASTGRETMVGRSAVVQTTLDPDGTVLMDGELWHATVREGSVQPGARVTVAAVEGLTLMVKKN